MASYFNRDHQNSLVDAEISADGPSGGEHPVVHQCTEMAQTTPAMFVQNPGRLERRFERYEILISCYDLNYVHGFSVLHIVDTLD